MTNNKPFVQNIKKTIYPLFILLFTCFFSYYLCMVDIRLYETQKQTAYFIAASILLVLCLLLRKSDFYKRIGALSVFLVYMGHVANWLYDSRENWGPELMNFFIWKYVAIGFSLLVLMDILKHGTGVYFDKKNIFLYVTLIAFGIGFMLEPDFTMPLIIPCLFFYTVPFEKKTWKIFEISLPIGIIFSFVLIMTKAIVKYNENYTEERFYGLSGIAQNGALCGLAFICVLFLLYKNITEFKSIMTYVLLGALLLYAGYFLAIVQSRSGIMGAAVTTLVFLAVYLIRSKKAFLITLSSVIVTGALGILGLFAKYNSCIKNGTSVPHMLSSFSYIKTFFDKEAYVMPWGDIGPEHRFVNTLDHIFSGRLSIWFAGFKQTTLFGKNPTTIVYAKGNMTAIHAHCNLVDWIIRYGWIVGILINIWFIYLFVKVMVKAIKTHELNFLFFAVVFCLTYTLFDVQYWNRAVPFTVLLLQYTELVPKFKDEQ